MLLAVLFLICGGCGSEPEQMPHATESGRDTVATVEYVMDDMSRRIFDQTMAYAREEDLHERSLGEIMQAVGDQFRGKPYVAGILDEPGDESLICRLDGFDCVTFVETAFAMARVIAQQCYSVEQFRANLLETRYRGGDLDGYCSRIHYFTEWVVDNEERGNVEDVTAEIGGERLNKRFNFMTENRERYTRLADNDELFECVREMESNLAEHTFHYVRQDDISSVYTELQAGDIVALVTDIEGLDVTHTGLVYDNGDGSKGLLHASTSGGVIVSPDLQRYVTNNRRQIGILVARPAGA